MASVTNQALKHLAQVCLDLEARQADESARAALQRLNGWAIQCIENELQAAAAPRERGGPPGGADPD